MGRVQGIGSARLVAGRQVGCYGDLNARTWEPFDCGAEVTWVTVGLRPVRPRKGLDVVLVPSCDTHLHAVRAYASEFGPAQSMDPSAAVEVGKAVRDREAPGQRVILIEANTA